MDPIQQRLKDAGLRATRHRIAVLEALEALGRPVSHPEILREIAHTRIDRVTLYRTLTSLSEVRLVHQVQGTDGVWRFCFHGTAESGCPGGHAHFLCEKCGMMVCLMGIRMPHIEVPDRYRVHHKQMLVTGLCPACAGTDADT